jgi:hypothetical protein
VGKEKEGGVSLDAKKDTKMLQGGAGAVAKGD